ncbi:enoyl-CoA hydratase [Bryobacterales bacterium F-183]|nr:enoyl-CoA hydratase [Bryobacterales bacterium F-183]
MRNAKEIHVRYWQKDMSGERIKTERSDNGILRITLNRPEKRNALDSQTIHELHQALDNSHDAGAVLITAAGKDFCSGADLAALQRIQTATILENRADAQQLADLFLAMRAHPRPIIAAVQGRALAGGCGLATACDVVLAAESAQFGYPEIQIGFVPAIVMALLRRQVSEKRAFDLVVNGTILSASDAQNFGLITRMYTDAEFVAASEAYAIGLAGKPREAAALCKSLLYRTDGLSFDAAIAAGVDTNAIARSSEECRAGVARFLSQKQTKS